MSAVDTKFYDKKKSTTFYVAIVFFVLVVVISWGLFVYNSQLENKNLELTNNINQIEKSIQAVESDPNIQAYSIFEKNQVFLENLSKQSEIPSFVSHLRKYFSISWLESSGFSYSAWMVSVDLSAQTNDNGYAYQKVVSFLRDYNALGEEALFETQFIPSFDGYDRVNFTGEFKLK